MKSELGVKFETETAFSIEALRHEVALCLKKRLHIKDFKAGDEEQLFMSEDEPNADEREIQQKRQDAATKIQSWFRGNFIRSIIKARDPSKILMLFVST